MPSTTDKIKIVDKRKKNSWGEDLKNTRTGEYDKNIIRHLVTAAYRQGNDPVTTLAYAMQESGIGNDIMNRPEGDARDNVGQVQVEKWKNDPALIEEIKKNPDLNPHAVAMNYIMKKHASEVEGDEAHKIQAYNGWRLHANNDIGAKKMYGIDLTQYPKGYDLKKDPKYGKSVLDLRENVLKQNPELIDYINSLNPNEKKAIQQQPTVFAGLASTK